MVLIKGRIQNIDGPGSPQELRHLRAFFSIWNFEWLAGGIPARTGDWESLGIGHCNKAPVPEHRSLIVQMEYYLIAYLQPRWSETEREARPLARRRAMTLRPSLVAILSRKPCLLTLLRLEGWNVLFISIAILINLALRGVPFQSAARFGLQNYKNLLKWPNI